MKRHPVFVILLAPVLGGLAAASLAGNSPLAPAGAAESPPLARKAPVVDRYHGVEVVDDYRWLESWDDPAVQAWSAAQNAHARSILDRLPGIEAIRREVTAVRKLEIPRYEALTRAGGTLFAFRFEPPRQQPVLIALPGEDDPAAARVIVDPNAIDPSGTTAMDWYVPSPDGSLVAVSLSKGGSERGDLHVYETGTGKQTGDVIPRVYIATAGGDVAWDAEGRGFFYTRYPRAGERPAADMDFYLQVHYHRLGTPEAADRYEMGKDLPRIAEIHLERSPDGRAVLANVQNGDSNEFEQHLRTADGRWLRLTRFGDQVVDGWFAAPDSLYLLSRAGAPRGKLLEVSLADVIRRGSLDLSRAAPIVPESDGVIQYDFWMRPNPLVVTPNRLFLVEGTGGPHRVRIFDRSGKPLGSLPLPPASAVSQMLAAGGKSPDAVLYLETSGTESPTWYRFTPSDARAVKTALAVSFPVNFGDVEVVRDEAVSKDGTRVPLTLLFRKGLPRDGDNPALLLGYGGFGWSMTPYFDPTLRVWIDHGGVMAIANLRGGGELGEEWHRAGILTRKQNGFDDFIAVAEHLVRAGYTNPGRLAIEGGSNGGLLMGAVLTQRPDLFKAVVSHVGIYDMLRLELDPNGQFNVPEYGSVKDPEQFRALLAYSPYHRVRDGVAYPPLLMLTGANDPRVNPMHSRKMAARLQAAGAPRVLLRTSATSGHGLDTALDEQIEQKVDVLAFLFDQLGMTAPLGVTEPRSSAAGPAGKP